MAVNLAVACRLRSFTRCAGALRNSACSPTVAVLSQAIDPPVINGVCNPRKPGVVTLPGYQDPVADIAYALRHKSVRVLNPNLSPSDSSDEDWSFPDAEEGIIIYSQNLPLCQPYSRSRHNYII
ncbi:hypothetical protein Aspvir_003618 [Aspergillus viridinutans]|uniref:Uncharacterized protein n=1 Tax=Aspergillus viridinutans TaxID=75553 RepID=A0A9P3BNI3_ASPVI|nr:uncharacterized protein Aspvir_003618 [Aspergillus viridinutans]GIJ99617.1 hypothetical protein Aspvir_003618 [Aspergillus viridinutans]